MARLLLLVPPVALALSFVVGAHVYVARRMIEEPALPVTLSSILTGALVLLGSTLALQPVGERLLRPRAARWIAWPASLWMGFAFLMLVGLAATDLLLWLGTAAARAASDGAGDGSLPVARTRAAMVLLGAAGATVLGIRQAFSPPQERCIEVSPAGWPPALDGFRIAQISDIHIGPVLGRKFARQITDRVNRLGADLVAVTGDLVDGRVALLRDEVAPFSELRGRLGVYFVTGNHDHYSGARAWAEEARRLGMRVLRNEHIELGEGHGRFVLAGVDDHNSRHLPGEQGEDLDAALAGVPDGLPIVLLAHDPSTFKRASLRGIALQLSGHTHGGQIRPFDWLVRLAIPYVAGLYRKGEALLYVSRGTGFWGPPIRLGAPAEITEIVLRSPQVCSPGSR